MEIAIEGVIGVSNDMRKIDLKFDISWSEGATTFQVRMCRGMRDRLEHGFEEERLI